MEKVKMTRHLNQADSDKLEAADQDVSAVKIALALQLLDADGRLEQFEGHDWEDLPPMFRWMAHKLLNDRDLRLRIIQSLQG
jgi:hypothetical protein